MKKVGLIGGIGPASTMVYYSEIIKACREITKDDNYPEILINSINMTGMLKLVAANDRKSLVELLSAEIDKLISIGAELIAVASNTPHMVINELIEKTFVPVISIVEETCKYAKNLNLKKVLFTGTLFAMSNDFYAKALAQNGIECIMPDDNDKEKIHSIIFPDLENGIINEKDKLAFKIICNKIIIERNIDGLILGCTELPLMIKHEDFDIAVIDTMDVHIRGIVERMAC